MSEKNPEFNKLDESSEASIDLSHAEEKSITGSAQSIGIEPSEDFIAPTMALDSIEPEPNE